MQNESTPGKGSVPSRDSAETSEREKCPVLCDESSEVKLLWDPTAKLWVPVVPPLAKCEDCDGTGRMCYECWRPLDRCRCGRERYWPGDCHTCEGLTESEAAQ